MRLLMRREGYFCTKDEVMDGSAISPDGGKAYVYQEKNEYDEDNDATQSLKA